jgi:DNA polymerase III delta prime subunit
METIIQDTIDLDRRVPVNTLTKDELLDAIEIAEGQLREATNIIASAMKRLREMK